MLFPQNAQCRSQNTFYEFVKLYGHKLDILYSESAIGQVVSKWGCGGRRGGLAGLKAVVRSLSGVTANDLESVKKLERKGAKIHCALGASVTKLTKASLNSR